MRNGDPAFFRWMLELHVIAGLVAFGPTVSFKLGNDAAAVHCVYMYTL